MYGLWPDLRVRVGMAEPIPPFTGELQKATYVFFMEKLRNGVSELVKLFSFSFGHGKYWVPKRARSALDAAITELAEKSGNFPAKAVDGNLDQFLEDRRAAIHRDCAEFFRRFYPNSPMPSDVVDKVISIYRTLIIDGRQVPRSTQGGFNWRS